jgi:uncharacterized cupredoxin-like copper-binding protein
MGLSWMALAIWMAATPASADSVPRWMSVDSAARTVRLELEVTPVAGGLAAINGHRDGDLRIVVPKGWTVQWRWRNADTVPHSLVLMAEREKLPERGGRPALTNALSRMVATGLKPGQTDETTFVADEAGWYWLLCGVPGHALKGEWIGLQVDPDARMPTVATR